MRHAIAVLLCLAAAAPSPAAPSHVPDSLLRLARADAPGAADHICAAALWWRDRGQLDSAAAVLSDAARRFEAQADTASLALVGYHLGGVEWRAGRYREAQESYQRSAVLREAAGDRGGASAARVNLGLVQRDQGDYAAALATLRGARADIAAQGDNLALANAHSLVGGVFLRTGAYDSALACFHKALEIRLRSGDSALVASSYGNLASLYRTTGVRDSAARYFARAIDINAKLGLSDRVAYNHLNLGGMHWEAKSYRAALDNYVASLRIYDRLGDATRQATALENIGLIYRELGDFRRALEYHATVLGIYRRAGNEPREAIALGFIAGDHLSAGDYDLSLDTYRQSLALRERLGNLPQVAATRNSMGLVHRHLGHRDSALACYRRALEIYTQAGDQRNRAATLGNIANLWWRFGAPDSARRYFDRSLAARRSADDPLGEGHTSLQYAEFLLERGDARRSLALAGRAFDIAGRAADWTLRKDAALLLSRHHERRGDARQALEYYKTYHQSLDSLNSDETLRRIAEMEIRFENEKKERVMARQQFDIELQAAKIKEQEKRHYYMLAAIALLSGLVVTVYVAWRQKRRSAMLLAAQKGEIERQRDTISDQNEKITDSIVYASRIQKAMLPPDAQMRRVFPRHFVHYRPRDVVSGDFYWAHSEGGVAVAVAADCTGHGVPGAFMSMLGISVLNDCRGRYRDFDAAAILDELRARIRANLHQVSFREDGSNDGIDLGMVILDPARGQACFAGGNVPLWVVRRGQIEVVQPDRMPVGVHYGDEQPFRNQLVDMAGVDALYMFSDGVVDQFGGAKGRKLMQKGLRALIEGIWDMPADRQGQAVAKSLDQWRGSHRQIDDILLLGIMPGDANPQNTPL